jgi:hypothetical protein
MEPTLIGAVLDENVRDVAEHYVRVQLAAGRLRPEEGAASVALYGDPLGDAMTWRLTHLARAAVGREVHPSYGFLRVYWASAELPMHTDRAGCDLTMSVAVARDPRGGPWPLRTIHCGRVQDHDLEPGDALLIAGRDTVHGRPVSSSGWSFWYFLHWVYSDLEALDGRVGYQRSGPIAG